MFDPERTERAPAAGELLDGGLPMTARQEQFSLAFIRMIAAASGCSIKSHETDYDGVDITIASSTEYKTWYCPEIEIQLKCTTQRDLLGDEHLAWTLKRKPFTKLTHPKRYLEAFLGVLLIPRDDELLLDLTEERLTTDSRMYWQRADLLGHMADGAASKTVQLPRSNLFDVDGLKGIMQEVGEGGEW